LALLNGPQNVSTAADRLAGFQLALVESGLNPAEQIILSGAYTRASGAEMTHQALAASPRPTALFAANNFIALGTLQALEETGVRVPEDMAVVTFDDLPESLVISPFLTVAAQPVYEMAARATQLLIQRLSGKAPPAFAEIVFPTRLIIRKSSGTAIHS
jgi:LacI family transcriptional regulator